MINEVRTLLLNIDGTPAVPADYPGEEFVPADFLAIVLPQTLLHVQQLLFGHAPDRLMLNYRLRQYMTSIHASRLEPFVTDLDPRITYWPLRDTTLYSPATFGVTVAKVAPTTADLFPQGVSTGVSFDKLLREWLITVVNATDVRIQQTQGGFLDVILGYVISGGLSNVITIPGANLGFVFQPGIGNQWTYRYITRPVFTLVDILQQLDQGLSDASMTVLFSGGEPYTTFRNLWFDREELPLRLNAILLALTYKTRELR